MIMNETHLNYGNVWKTIHKELHMSKVSASWVLILITSPLPPLLELRFRNVTLKFWHICLISLQVTFSYYQNSKNDCGIGLIQQMRWNNGFQSNLQNTTMMAFKMLKIKKMLEKMYNSGYWLHRKALEMKK